jgi:hypothetical protein
MAANILRTGVAAAVPVKARHWLDRTKLKGFAEDIARWKPRPIHLPGCLAALIRQEIGRARKK